MKNNNNKYYTSICTMQYLIGCMVFIGVNFFVYGWVRNKFVDVIMIIFQCVFLAMNFSYIVWGIKDKTEHRLKWMMFMVLILVIFESRNHLIKEISVLITTTIMSIYYWICYQSVSKMNGDNKNCLDTVNYDYFSYVNTAMLGLRVLFPLDIGNNKRNRKEGIIRKIGKAMSGKYRGEIVCLVESGNQFYLCPVKKIYPIELLKDEDDNILARTAGMVIKLLNWEDDRCKGYFSVVGI